MEVRSNILKRRRKKENGIGERSRLGEERRRKRSMRKGVKGGKEDTEEEKKEKEGVQVEGVEEGEGGEGGECFLTGTRMQRQVHLPTAAQPLLQ